MAERPRRSGNRLRRGLVVAAHLPASCVTALVTIPATEAAASVPGAPALLTTAAAPLICAVTCGALALVLRRHFMLRRRMRVLEARIKTLSDRAFELTDAAERTRSLLEAQGDVIVRRDAGRRITYINDAFCDRGAHRQRHGRRSRGRHGGGNGRLPAQALDRERLEAALASVATAASKPLAA